MSGAESVSSKEKRVEELAAGEQRVLEGGDIDEIANLYDRTDTCPGEKSKTWSWGPS